MRALFRAQIRLPALLGLLIAGWLAVASPLWAAEPVFPPLAGRVVDEAGLLSPAARDQIAGWLESFERQSRRQVVVVTVKNLQGFPIEDFGYRLGRAWGIGDKDRNTGALLVVAPAERAVRIEVGYGLEATLTDAISRAIIETDMLPAFRQGKYEQGISAGASAMLSALGWNGAAAEAARSDEAGSNVAPVGLIVLFVLIMLLRGRGIWLGGHGGWASPGRSRDRFSGRGGSFGGGGASGHW